MDLSWDFFGPRRLSLNGKFNFLQAGAACADLVNTVSRAYEKELLSRKHASGLGSILRQRGKAFTSVRNGLDRESWDPGRDPYIAAPFGPGRTEGKASCKQDLIAAAGLALTADRPLLAFVSHLSRLKGADLLSQSLEEIVDLEAGVIIFGEGEERYQKEFVAAARRFPGRVVFKSEPGPVFLHKIIAGADVLLLPSLVEPSGLNLFAAFRYGTVPVVRATGGLKEAVRPYNFRTGSGNGFAFVDYSAEALVRAVRLAVDCRASRPAHWRRLMEEGMRQEFSWEETARGYADLYVKALKIKRGG
jgi:starch synthase